MGQQASGVDVLTIEGVAVRFGGVAALSDANLSVKAGTVTGLIGPNGAGKTTLFNVISGLQTPDRGTVLLYDTDITGMKPPAGPGWASPAPSSVSNCSAPCRPVRTSRSVWSRRSSGGSGAT
jgi:energy-coupling factor transporter ATP-binding protein EcfA2